jgi:hypothetical protein
MLEYQLEGQVGLRVQVFSYHILIINEQKNVRTRNAPCKITKNFEINKEKQGKFRGETTDEHFFPNHAVIETLGKVKRFCQFQEKE